MFFMHYCVIQLPVPQEYLQNININNSDFHSHCNKNLRYDEKYNFQKTKNPLPF